MKSSFIFLSLCISGSTLATGVTWASDENTFLGEIRQPTEQTVGGGQSTLWTLPLVATQYHPMQPDSDIQAALQAQHEGRFVDAQMSLDKAGAGSDAELLRASFFLQGNLSRQALEILAPFRDLPRYAAEAYALTAMAQLKQGQMPEALKSAQHAHELNGGVLPQLALSYALQANGRLLEAFDVMHRFNQPTPQAITLAREAELALTLGQPPQAKSLANRALIAEPTNSYVIAVSGLVFLIGGKTKEAKNAFEKTLQRDPQDAKALLGLGLAEVKVGNFREGQQKLQAADEASPNNALILTYLGRSQQRAGQTVAAQASWQRAQQIDPKDPMPWLFQAQAELQENHPLQAREILREAQARVAYRAVYRGETLLKEDAQLLQANLAEVQRQLGMESLAFQTLSDSSSERNSASLRNQADILQGQRFAESARRSLLLQSQFGEKPGNLPSQLDIYSDDAWQAGASSPQHGIVSGLSAQQASYNNYDELFNKRTTLEADATAGSKNNNGEQIRLGVGNDTLGLSLAQRQFKTDGFAPFDSLDNHVAQGIVQWRPSLSTQAFVSHQTFNSQHGEVIYPGSATAVPDSLTDNSKVTRLGLRHDLSEKSELRGLWSNQPTDYAGNYAGVPSPYNVYHSSGSGHSEELQYLLSKANHTSQWGVQHTHGRIIDSSNSDYTSDAQQLYAAWQQKLDQHWQLDVGMGWGKIDKLDNKKISYDKSTKLESWMPKLGAVYTPDAVTHLRFAAWQNIGMLTSGDASLAPATLDGYLLNRPGDDGKLVHSIALGGDRQLSQFWLLDAQIQRRKTGNPAVDPNIGAYLIEQQLDESKLALHWQRNSFATSLAYDHERIKNDVTFFALDSVNEQVLNQQQLNIKWFANQRLTADLKWSHNQVFGTQHVYNSSYNQIFPTFQNSFNQLDVDLNWKFNGSRGQLNVGVRNVFDKRFQYADIDRLNPRFSNGRMLYATMKNAW